MYENREKRYRFTLAHELGHIVLHPQLFDQLLSGVRTIDAWATLIREIPSEIYDRVEWQAYTFAGLILVPTDPLLAQYKLALATLKPNIDLAKGSGIAREAYIGPAWDSLCKQIADPFNVSSLVIQKRLGSEGYSANNI